jgi:hypothetical protein
MATGDELSAGNGDAWGPVPRLGSPGRPVSASAVRGVIVSASSEDLAGGTCVQEWNGKEWMVVDTTECGAQFECRPLDPAKYRGQFVGHRVLTPGVRKPSQ